MNSQDDGLQKRPDGAAPVEDAEQMSDDSVHKPSAEVEMNQPSKATIDMTGSKSANVEQPQPEQPLPQHDNGGTPQPPSASNTSAMENESQAAFRQVPIPPASEPLQYRAIGLIRGVYNPSEEQFTRGTILTKDDTAVDAVLLGRVMSLVKKHVDLSQPHLWVVYPRTRPKHNDLHAQIVGIWEPENLHQDDEFADGNMDDEDDEHDRAGSDYPTNIDGDNAKASGIESELKADDDSEAGDSATLATSTQHGATQHGANDADSDTAIETGTSSGPKASAHEAFSSSGVDGLQDGYFSIRGEVVRQSRGGEDMTIKICQAPRRGEKQGRVFKLSLKGSVNRRAVGSFWDMHVQRQGNDLVIQEANFIKDMPPTKRRGRGGPPRHKKSGPPRRRQDRPSMAGQRQGDRQMSSRPVPKPIKRKSRSSSVQPD